MGIPLVEWMDKNKDSKSVSVIRYLAQGLVLTRLNIKLVKQLN